MHKINEYRSLQDGKSTTLSHFLKQNYLYIVVSIVLLFSIGLLLGFLLSMPACQGKETSPMTVSPTLTSSSTPISEVAPTATSIERTSLPDPSPTAQPTFTPQATSTPLPPFFEGPIEYGRSFNGAPLYAYRLGYGPSKRALIGGIHGGYEWNTVNLVSETLEHLKENPSEVPENVTLYIIPNMNPDGYAAGTDPIVARMNGNGVDLNRNWNYQWQMTATHGTRPVKAGSAPFSEPETRFTRDFILEHDIELAIFYHSALGVIFSGTERDKAPTYELAEMLSEVTGYRHQTEGIPGQITTGDAIDYLSDIGIAAAEVELTTHGLVNQAERQRNLEGVRAFLRWDIPKHGPALTPEELETGPGTLITYTVKAQDTLLDIAIRFDIDLETLQYVNGLTDADFIREGQVLSIPIASSEE